MTQSVENLPTRINSGDQIQVILLLIEKSKWLSESIIACTQLHEVVKRQSMKMNIPMTSKARKLAGTLELANVLGLF
jgi:hypothetical protein